MPSKAKSVCSSTNLNTMNANKIFYSSINKRCFQKYSWHHTYLQMGINKCTTYTIYIVQCTMRSAKWECVRVCVRASTTISSICQCQSSAKNKRKILKSKAKSTNDVHMTFCITFFYNLIKLQQTFFTVCWNLRWRNSSNAKIWMRRIRTFSYSHSNESSIKLSQRAKYRGISYSFIRMDLVFMKEIRSHI